MPCSPRLPLPLLRRLSFSGVYCYIMPARSPRFPFKGLFDFQPLLPRNKVLKGRDPESKKEGSVGTCKLCQVAGS